MSQAQRKIEKWTGRALRLLRDVSIIGLCAGGALAYQTHLVQQNTNVSAVAHVLIERSGANMPDELEALRAAAVKTAVIKDLNLAASAEFLSRNAQTVPGLTALKSLVGGLLGHNAAIDTGTALPSPEARWSETVETGIEPHSRILKVVVTLPNPQLAVNVADALANHYVQMMPETPVPSRLDQLRANVDDLQRQLQSARQTAPTQSASLAAPQKRLEMLTKLLRQGQIFDAAEKIGSESVNVLLQERTRLKSEIQFESKTLLDQHPKMIALKDQLARIETEIRANVVKAEAALRQEAQHATPDSVADVSVPDLESQLTTAQQKLNEALLKVANGGETVQKQAERIVVPAELPKAPAMFDAMIKALPAALYGALMGVGLAILNRALRRRKPKLHVPREISAQLDDNIDHLKALVAQTHQQLEPQPVEPKTSVKLSQVLARQGRGAVLLHGSSQAAHLMLAEEDIIGQIPSICLVDLSMKHRSKNAGLSEILSGKIELDRAIRQDRFTGLNMIEAGQNRRGSFGLELVIASLQDCFDLVVLEGLDVLSSDFETIAPVLDIAVLSQQPEDSELAFCIANYVPDSVEILHRAAPQPLKKAA